MESIIIALLAAVCTSLTTIFAKIGIEKVNSNFATAFRTFIVILFSGILCWINGDFLHVRELNWQNWLFLVLSGIMTGCSWLCYYKAVKLGDIHKVAPIDKASFVLTNILFLIFFFNDTTKNGDILTIAMLLLSMALMLLGTLLMVQKKKNDEDEKEKEGQKWLVFAILSSVFASLVALFVKIGLKGISSNLGTFFRTIVVFVFASFIVIGRKEYKETSKISKKSWLFLTLSGLATGGAWLLEYSALNLPNANLVVVNSIGKLSILLTMLFSYFILKEKFTKRSILGLALIVCGILAAVIFSL